MSLITFLLCQMFKLFQIQGKVKSEIFPEAGIYTVRETTDYCFIYQSENIENNIDQIIFFEDLQLESKWYSISGNTVESLPNKYFQDYFGFTGLKINKELFKINIQIDKLKVSEIEDILIKVWENENRLFNVFFSKSSVKARIDKDGNDIGLTSKYLLFIQYYINSFKNLFQYFKANPHYVVRKKTVITDYSPRKVSESTVDWILFNLDEVKFSNSFINYPDTIKIENQAGYIENILTDDSFNSFDTYENRIILSSFRNILLDLKKIQNEINRSQIIKEEFGRNGLVDFRDLKKIPLKKLYEDTINIQNQLWKIFNQYKRIFKNCKIYKEALKTTNVFSNKQHYKLAFKLLKESTNIKYNLDGDLQLLNIKKLSQLYEAYNYIRVNEAIVSSLNMKQFSISKSNSLADSIYLRDDGLPSFITYSNSSFTIKVYYELQYPNSDTSTELVRIDTRLGNYYEPDYIVEIIGKNSRKYLVLDSKYTRFPILKDRHLPDCVFKYVVNTGIKDEEFRKVDYLVMLYPGDLPDYMLNNKDYSPKILNLPSKPKMEIFLNDFIYSVFEKILPKSFITEN